MRFRVLGPLEVWREDGWRSIGTDKPRSLFACLLLNAGQIVAVDNLVFELWGDAPPPTAGNLISVYVHQLRRALGDEGGDLLAYRRPGYRVTVGTEDTDLQRFESLAARGRDALAAGDAQTAAGLLSEAEGLWRGRFLADVVPSALVSTEAERAAELRLSAAERHMAADLECGRHAEVIPELRRMVAEHPLRERLWLLLMRALNDSGRHAESVGAYGEARLVIAEQLGVDPGPELQQFHAELIATAGPVSSPGTPAGARDPGPVGLIGVAEPGPAQLPADTADFTGRETELARLCGMLTPREEPEGPGAVRIAVVIGAAGAGKTALALRAAHQVRADFPDGQLYADLSGALASPHDVLARFLRDLGVADSQIPADAEERAAHFRTKLADKSVLVVLDGAKDAAQVRPLLPGGPSCAVLITSRGRTLSVTGTGFVDLGTLPYPDALKLFSRIAGSGRVAAEPKAAGEIIAACGGLPLAIRICAARLAQRPHWPVAAMTARLRDERHRLDELRVGDLEVRASFRGSYDSLPAECARLTPARAFRLLSLCEGQQISLPAAAALLGERKTDTSWALETLVDASLVESPEADCYQFRDLLRLFAAECARIEEPEEERRAAAGRLFQWNLGTARAVGEALSEPAVRRQDSLPNPDVDPGERACPA